MTLEVKELGGNCPVQAAGTVDGWPFYFRARGEWWSFSVVEMGEDPFGADGWWNYKEKWGEWPAAGWMTREEAMGCIEKAAQKFREREG